MSPEQSMVPSQENPLDITVVCADIGSVRNERFGWYASKSDWGSLPSTLASFVASAICSGHRVALGFECPLFVPLRADEQRLTMARLGEGNRSWSAGAGCGALATGIVQVCWVLQEIRNQAGETAKFYSSWTDFVAADSGLFVWEAFVSGESKRAGHIADAECAVEAFHAALPDIALRNAVVPDSPVHSLIGSALLRTGWTIDLNVLSKASIVIRG